MKARKLVKPPEEQEETLMLQSYSIEGKSWEKMQPVKFLIEKEKFAEGGFWEAFKTTCLNPNFSRKWVLKFYKQEKAEAIQETLKISVEDHTRKQVQMHAVARHLAVKFGKRLLQAGYGGKLSYNKVYYTNSSKGPNTMEEYVDGQYFKYINNNGHIVEMSGSSEEIKEISKRAEAFCHFTYQISNNQFMVLDIQGSGNHLYDPEIVTAELFDSNDEQLNFCAGNLSTEAISNFLKEHNCNKYCIILGLSNDS